MQLDHHVNLKIAEFCGFCQTIATFSPRAPHSLDANGVVAEVTALGRRGSLLAGLHRARPPAAPLAHYDEDEQAAPRPHCLSGKSQ